MFRTVILASILLSQQMPTMGPQSATPVARIGSARPELPLAALGGNETCAADCCSVCDSQAGDAYAKAGWSTIHGDARNSSFAPGEASTALRVGWTALDGAMVKIVPTAAPDGLFYVTTGQGPGTSHLHAFNMNGQLLWESDPQITLDDLDSGVVYSAAVTDAEGDVYVSDLNQFWAFRSDGQVKWTAPMPDPDSYMATAILVRSQYVGGVTTNGKVVLFDRQTGSLAFPVLHLPGGAGPPGDTASPGLWAGGMIDPAIKQTVVDSFFGYAQQVTNTPSVHPETGRVYITAVGDTPDEGILYGIDVLEEHLEIAFAPRMDGPSGTSPAISPDGRRVYAVDVHGVLIAFDADTGKEYWRASGAAEIAAPAIGLDGTVYTAAGKLLIALDPLDGAVRWQINYDEIAESVLHRILPSAAFPTGLPIARTNSVVSVSPSEVWVSFVLGYEFAVPDSDKTLTQPRETVLAALDPLDGTVISVTPLRDTHEGVVGLTTSGRVLIPHGSMLSSIFYNDVNPSLPAFLRTTEAPIGGFSVLVPLSFRDHAVRGLEWAKDRLQAAALALNQEDCEAVRSALCLADTQLQSSATTLSGDAVEEVGPATSQDALVLVQDADDDVRQARKLLDLDPTGAADAMLAATATVDDAIQRLRPLAQMEILPASCPKSLDLDKWSRRPLKVALVASTDFDVRRVDLNSLALSRADGVGAAVRPLSRRFGGLAVRSTDIASATVALVCACEPAIPDGMTDRVISFSRNEVVDDLALRLVPPGTSMRLVLHGRLLDGTPFQASDCLTIGRESRSR